MRMKPENMTLQNYMDDLQARGLYWFTRSEAKRALGLSTEAFKKAVYRTVAHGKINLVRGDFYTIVPAEYRATGSLPATWFIDTFMSHIKQNYYVGLLTAAALHGAAHQQPMAFQVITDKATRPIINGQVRIEFHYKKNINSVMYQNIKTSTGIMYLSTPETAAFDLMRYINAAGQINHVATILIELIEKIDLKKLAELLRQGLFATTTAQRLGYLIDELQLDIDTAPLENVLQQKKLYDVLLVPRGKQVAIIRNRKWHILVNEQLEIDEI